MAGNTKVNFYDGQIVDEQDLDTEQLYNRTVASDLAVDFSGAGVLDEKITYPILFNKNASDRDEGTPKVLDGLALDVLVQPSDSTFGNQLKVTLSSAVLVLRPTQVFIVGRVYDDSKDSKSSIAVELIEFDREESQITKNYFISNVKIITQNFFGNATPTILSADLDTFLYDGTLEPDDALNTYVWTKISSGFSSTYATGGKFYASHDDSAALGYILPTADLGNNRYYQSETRWNVSSVNTVTTDVLHPNRAFSNILPIFMFDGNKIIAVTLIKEGGVDAVALFDFAEYVDNDYVLPSNAVITSFEWDDDAFHTYNITVSVDNNTVVLVCDEGETTETTLSALYSAFSTYLGGLVDLTFGGNTYFGFSSGLFTSATTTNSIEVDYHKNVIRSEDATECQTDRTQQITGQLVITEAPPLIVARDALMAAQTVSPNIKFRSVSEATNTLGNVVEPAFRVYDPDNALVTVESVIVSAIGGDLYADDLLEDISTPDIADITLPYNTSLSTIIGEKFLATTNNIQKVRLLLAVTQDTTKTGADQYDWSGDLIVGIRPLQTTVTCAGDEAPVNAIDYDPDFNPLVQVSIDQDTLKDTYGITLTDIPIEVDFDFSQTSIATPGGITSGNYYVVTIRRSGDIRTGTIELKRGNDYYDDGMFTYFDGTSWTDDSNTDLWFEVYTSAVRVGAGTAYDRGVRVTAEKTQMNSTTGLLEQNPHGPYSLVTNTRDEYNYVVVEEEETGTDVEAHPRTGNAVFSRLEDTPEFSIVSDDSLDTLKETLYPVTLACVEDTNCRSAFTLNGTFEYIGLAMGNQIVFLDTDDNFLTLVTEDLRGCIIAPDVDDCDARYRITNKVVGTQYYGDVNGDGEVDVNDYTDMAALIGESFTSETTQQKIIGQKEVSYAGLTLPQNDSDPWTAADDTDAGVTVSATVNGGILTLTKTGGLAPLQDTLYGWYQVEELLASSTSWEVNFRGRISTATFLNPAAAFNRSASLGLWIAEDMRHILMYFIYDRVNNRKYIGMGIGPTAYQLDADVFDINDFLLSSAEVDFTEYHTYKLEKTTAGMFNLYIDNSTTASISTALTNFYQIEDPDLLSNAVLMINNAYGSCTFQVDYINYEIQSLASITALSMLRADVTGNGTISSTDLTALTDYLNDGTPFSVGESFQTVTVTVEDLDDPCRTVDLIDDIPAMATLPFSSQSYRLICNCTWNDKAIEITDIRKMLNNVVMENGSTNCSDRGDNTLVMNNDMVIKSGDILGPTGLPYHYDQEVIELTIDLPNYPWVRGQFNVFDEYINGKMYFSDGTLVGSSAITNNQIRVSASIQSEADLYEYNIESDGYGDGYGAYSADVAVYNVTDCVWDTSPSSLIIGEKNGKEYETYVRFPMNAPADNLTALINNSMPFILNALFEMTALDDFSPQDVYRVSLIGDPDNNRWRDLPPFDLFATPPPVITTWTGGDGTMIEPIRFEFYDALVAHSLVHFPRSTYGQLAEEFQDIEEFRDIYTQQMEIYDTYGGGVSLNAPIHMFWAAEEDEGEAFAQWTGEDPEIGMHIGWKIDRETKNYTEYVEFDSGLVNLTRGPKLNCLAAEGSFETATNNAFQNFLHQSVLPHVEQNALYFDHSTGMLHINYVRPTRDAINTDSRTKILLTIHLKKAGFINQNVNVSANQLSELLDLTE